MSPGAFSNSKHAKKESYGNMWPLSPLKINKDSHNIKKSPCTSSTSSSPMANWTKPQQQRHPVIIYTHSPKVIHTHPRDFMALVQKLTGFSQDQVAATKNPKTEPGKGNVSANPNKGIMINDDNESTSVITDENGSNSLGDGQVNSSCFVPPLFDPPNPAFNNIPIFTPTSYDLLCSTHHPYFNFHHDPMFFMPPITTNSISSSSPLERLKDFPDFH